MKNIEAIKVDGNGKSIYDVSTKISFSLFSSQKEGRKQILSFDSCRDYINDCLISFFNVTSGLPGNSHWKETNPKVDTTRLRLLIAKKLLSNETKEELHNKLRAAKRIINMYEAIAGFKKRSVLRRVIHSNENIKHCWAFIGPPEWMKSSNLVSMITLIIRIVVESGKFEHLRNIREVENRFKELCFQHRGHYNDCGAYLSASWPKFRMLMEKYNELFRSKTTAFWYPSSMTSRWHSSGGIVSLCKFETCVDHIDDLMREACAEWEKKQIR